MTWSISYTSSSSGISCESCADADGYFYIAKVTQDTETPTASTTGGIDVASSQCQTHTAPVSDFTSLGNGTYAILLLDLPAEQVQQSLYFTVTASPFTVSPASDSTDGGGNGGGDSTCPSGTLCSPTCLTGTCPNPDEVCSSAGTCIVQPSTEACSGIKLPVIGCAPTMYVIGGAAAIAAVLYFKFKKKY